MMKPSQPRAAATGFSLVEVVIAIGIVSFALLVLVAVFGGVLRTSDDNADRQEIAESVNSLRGYLSASDFATVYGWTQSGKELLYVTYKAGPDGTPNPAASEVSSKWMAADASNITSLDAARSGRWIRARLGVSPSNPGGTSLPALASYARASLFVLAEMDYVETPSVPLKNHGRLQVTLSAHR